MKLPDLAGHKDRPHLPCMLVGWVVLLIALAGVLLWALAGNPKVAEIGRIMFFCGLLAMCFALSGKVARLL